MSSLSQSTRQDQTSQQLPALTSPSQTETRSIPALRQADVQALREAEFVTSCLSEKQQAVRTTVLGWWLQYSTDTLELRPKTVELACKLFDCYCHNKFWSSTSAREELKGEEDCKRGLSAGTVPHVHTLDSSKEVSLTVTACFFSAAKYNEIYPPHLNDFLIDEELFKRDVVLREVDIALVTDFGYNRTLASDWYQFMYGTSLPDWGLEVILYCAFSRGEELAKAVHEVEGGHKGDSKLTKVIRTLWELKVKITPQMMDRLVERKCWKDLKEQRSSKSD